LALVAALGLAVLGGVAAVGAGTVVSYATLVLPAHAASEFPANDQYSLTSILYQLGVPGKGALLAGSVSYVVALALGLAGGIALARRRAAPEFAVLFPAAAVLCGGTFIHNLQMGLAVPLAGVAANAAAETRYRGVAYLGVLAGAVPEPGWATLLLALGAGAAFAAAWASGRDGGYRAVVYGIGGIVAYVAFFYLVRKLGVAGHDVAASFPAAPAGDVAEGSWRAYVTSVSHPETRGEWLSRVAEYVVLLAGYVAAASPLTRGAGRDDDTKATLPPSSVSQRVLT
ncbi:MAG: hypothetical protein IAI48_03710, partial [Candidatus Eremiobacteraeota bacterium]|nr:hypothetical protein [Candidatus Eremiobacteraeota bacterium]